MSGLVGNSGRHVLSCRGSIVLVASFVFIAAVEETTKRIYKSESIIWAASSEFGTYRICEQQRFRQACAVSPEPPLLAHTSNESRETFRQKTRSLASLNGWACAVKICHDGLLEDTNSLDWPHIRSSIIIIASYPVC